MTSRRVRRADPACRPDPLADRTWSRNLRGTLIAIGFVTAIMGSLGAPLVPDIARSTGVSLSVADWLLTAPLLAGAVVTPVMGRLADGRHARRVLLGAMATVLAGAVVAACTSTFALLVAGRTLQGLGLGLLPVTMATARRHLSPPVAARTIALLSITSATGVGLGYPLTSVVAESAGYHAAFWTGAGLIAVVLAAAYRFLPRGDDVPRPSFDTTGALLLAAAITLLVLGLSEGETWGWASPGLIGILAGAVVTMAAWARHELRMRGEPLIELRHARDRMVLTAHVSGFLIAAGMYLFVPTLVEFIQVPRSTGYGFGSSILMGGCSLVPLSVGTLVASRWATRFEHRFGSRLLIPLGSAAFGAAMLLLAFEHRSLWEVFLASGVGGLGIGLSFAAMPSFIINSVASHETGSALGFYQLIRSVGLAVGSAVAATMLAAFTTGSEAFPRVGGFEAALSLGAGLCIVAGVASFVLPGRRRIPSVPDDARAEAAELEGSGLLLADVPTGGGSR